MTARAPEFLFVLQAAGAEAFTAPDGRRGTLRLDGVDPSLLAFTNRPIRVAETRPTAELVSCWSEYGFVDDPPNAALVVAGKAIDEPLALVLSEPRWDAAARTLEMAVACLVGDPVGALRRILGGGGNVASPVTLFVDATQGAPPATPPTGAGDHRDHRHPRQRQRPRLHPAAERRACGRSGQ